MCNKNQMTLLILTHNLKVLMTFYKKYLHKTFKVKDIHTKYLIKNYIRYIAPSYLHELYIS